jgi:hypothetical protein
VRLKISLDTTKPMVMRRIEVPNNVMRDTLQAMIEVLMPWGNDHPYGFRMRDRHWRIPDRTLMIISRSMFVPRAGLL